jgi:hypothetical protein
VLVFVDCQRDTGLLLLPPLSCTLKQVMRYRTAIRKISRNTVFKYGSNKQFHSYVRKYAIVKTVCEK